MMAELLAKETGVCRGRGGSMHMADLNVGSLGANGVVGGGLPLSVGAGLSMKMKGGDQVVLCFFGDGASNEGAFHESVNMAAIWKLPVVYICENNQYAMSMPVGRGVSARAHLRPRGGLRHPRAAGGRHGRARRLPGGAGGGGARPIGRRAGADGRRDLSLRGAFQE